ncbi:LysR family transcriptional regulator [Marinospirillum alkaliphilum]|uniref:DNA-binding transcriptional regulator, LysR family n=1 Tax=Marinospirillum alkaliphilum DSM 21637 TaxID=1122209 RepID=A0A1K1VJL6_9GAMM|nr:LysR family transcriptional regulator [Marinospirillum alkaliphilum]SFX25334.1 DNA-binding transcriptional regulator, LysR family [Marinospirillum alkaliphilum DSM 21637]
MSRATLEQWRMLKAVVDHGGFNQAAAVVHKSASSINHAVHKLQDQLGVQLLVVEGRKALLTEAGQALLRRASLLLEEAASLEDAAERLALGVEAVVRLAVDQIFPPDLLAQVLADFSAAWPGTRIELRESVLSGGVELLYGGEVDLLISGMPVQGFLGLPLMPVSFVCVAHPDHPLHQLQHPLSLKDLQRHRQLVVRDSATAHRVDAGWLKAEQRWTVSHVATSIRMLELGLGFAWLPLSLIEPALQAGRLKTLALPFEGLRQVPLQLIQADPDTAGPATRALVAAFLATAGGSDDSVVAPAAG